MTATAEAVAVPQSVQSTLSAAGLFEGFARDGFRLRDPAPSINGLPRFRAAGDCVEPLLTAGDGLFIDYSAQPQHGDLCLFEWPQSVIDRWHGSERKAEWVRQFGHADFSHGIKLLWRWPTGPQFPSSFAKDYLCARDGIRAVDGHKLLGVVRAVERGGVILPAEADLAHRVVPVASLDFNAATSVFLTSSTTTQSFSLLSGTNHNPENQLIVSPAPQYDATVIATVTINSNIITASGASSIAIEISYDDTGTGAAWQYSATSIPLTATVTPYTIQWQFSHSGANGTNWLGLSWDVVGATSSPTVGADYYIIQAEYIKR